MDKKLFFRFREEFSQNIQSFLSELEKYKEEEIFYKRCYELRSDQKALNNFFASFDEKELERRILELPTKDNLSEINEKYLFGDAEKKNILLCKHHRYYPAFNHYHDYFEVFYVLSGQCVNTIGTERFALPAGSLCFIGPYINHTLEVFDDSIVINICIRKTTFNEIFFNLLTSGDFLSGFFLGNLYPVDPIEYIVFNIGSDNEMIDMLFSMLIEQTRHDEYSDRIMHNLVSVFFSMVVRKKVKGQVTVGKVEQQRYISYINENFRSISLSDVAKHFNISRTHCSRIIKAVTGKSFSELLQSIRMRHALTMLATTNIKIEDVSLSLGYINQETFIRSFKKNIGLSPGQYRNKPSLYPVGSLG